MAKHDDPMRALNVEIPATLKARILEYARDNSMSQAVATRILLDQSLTEAGYPRKARR